MNDMNLPRSVSLLGAVWSVAVVDRDGPELCGNDGVAIPASKEIYIADDLSPLDTVDTFIHELLHLVNHAMSIPFSSAATEEKVVRPLATGLAAMLAETPGILRAIEAHLQAHRADRRREHQRDSE